MNIEAAQPATPLAFIALRIHTALIAPCPQEMLLNGSCQCFLILSVDFFPLNLRISPQLQPTLLVVFCLFFVIGIFFVPVSACLSRQYSELTEEKKGDYVYTGGPAESLKGQWL